MRILITGNNGFIGEKLAEYYIKKGHDVYGMDILPMENKKYKQYKQYRIDMLNDDIDPIIIKINPELIIHCAGNANVSFSVKEPVIDFQRNVQILYNVLNSLKKLDTKCRVVFLSSAAVYGNPKSLPIREEDELMPISPYGLHKKFCEEICMYYNNNSKLDIKCARIFSAYGEGLRKQLLWDISNKVKTSDIIELFGNGSESRDYIYINDLVKALDLLAFTESEDVIFNVANGKEIKIEDIANIFRDKYITKEIIFNGNVRKGDPRNWKADITRLKNIGYCQTTDIDAGVTNYIEWVQKDEK